MTLEEFTNQEKKLLRDSTQKAIKEFEKNPNQTEAQIMQKIAEDYNKKVIK